MLVEDLNCRVDLLNGQKETALTLAGMYNQVDTVKVGTLSLE